MFRSLDTGVTGLQQCQQMMEIISNNIANVGTVAFKSARTDFSDTFSQSLKATGADVMQIGTGVTTEAITNQMTQGAILNTSVNTDLAVNGEGFFIVKNTVDGATYATRAGNFKLDANGYLVNSAGLRVQGFSDAGLSTRGDLKIDNTGASSTAAVNSFNIDQDGKINVQLTDGTEFVRGQVLLQSFTNPQALAKEGGNLYSGLTTAGPLAQTTAPKTNGLGRIQSGALEQSNVDLTTQFSTLISAQRAFQANSRVITTSDEVMQELVNLKR